MMRNIKALASLVGLTIELLLYVEFENLIDVTTLSA